MRHLAAVLLGLLLIVSSAAAPLAQSGRKRGVPGTGASTNAPPADSRGVDSAAPETNEVRETVEGEVVRVNTNLVTVPVSVRDSNGRYAPDLRREDFHIFEDGVEQRIAYFATTDQPFTVALVIDTSGSTGISLDDMQSAAIAFVGRLKPADRVMVIKFDDSIKVLAEPTNDRAELTKAIRRARTGGGTRLYDAVDFVIKKRLQQIEGRKALVLFSDGVDTSSLKASYKSTVRLAEESNALIYTVSYGMFGDGLPGIVPTFPTPGGRINIGSPSARGVGRDDARRADAYLQELAQRSGGRFYRGGSIVSISQAFEWVADELRRQYSLGYYPNRPAQEGQRRQIKVRVARPNLIALARDSYVYTQTKTDAKETK